MGEPQMGQTYRLPLVEPRNWVPSSRVRCGVRAHTLGLRARRDPQLPVGRQPPRDPHLPDERKLFWDPHLPEEHEPCRHGRDLLASAGGPWGASDGAVLLASAGEVTELGYPLVRRSVRAHTLRLRACQDPQLPEEREPRRDPLLPEERGPRRHVRAPPGLASGSHWASRRFMLGTRTRSISSRRR